MAQRRQTQTVSENRQGRSPLFKGHKKVVIYFEAPKLASLVTEARRRADAKGAVRADVSEVVRDAVVAWLAAHGKR
jgi:hypothetical protein